MASYAQTDFPIAVLISGGGTTLRNLLQKRAAGELAAEVVLVISSDPDARGLRYAVEANIPTCIVQRNACDTPQAFSDAVFSRCREAGVRLVVMGGFLKHVLIPADFENRVTNIHPGLIPAFCGRGMYGHRVHEAVLDYGVKVSGCTIHFVDDHYDHGPVILQRVVPVEEDDTPERLAARIFEAECEAYPEAINLIAGGRVHVEDRRVRVEQSSEKTA